jgi:single-strand DNA-binding protein
MLSSYITVVGNVASEPKVEYGGDGSARCFFRVASTERKLNKESQVWEDKVTTFFSVTAWRDMAENVAKTLCKGDRVIVAGRFRSRDWVGKEGATGTALEVEADVIGPDLRWRSASIDRTERSRPGSEPAEEAAEAAPPTTPDWLSGGETLDPLTGEIRAAASAA